MRRLLIGVLLGMALSAPSLWALRTNRPSEFYEWNSNNFAVLNNTLLGFWNTLNGRYQIDRVTVDPDGSRPCSVGEQVFYDTGTDQLCICATEATKVWKCVNLT